MATWVVDLATCDDRFGFLKKMFPPNQTNDNGKSTMNDDVFHIENGDFPVMLVFRAMN